ncbi:histidine kinase dimerization/phospho-acceptor domain-containing protein [Pontixanthobacter sp.]|uniref:histidine kinase dimerization/phospho-acceptor domain-containing protein n=1 Tax=Pontixanthobacter sp. TaxID=2792078 RepID=UPI003C7D089F
MHFDDRLATVLRHRASGERAARTQFRQLLDLLGGARGGRDQSLRAAAWLRLAALGETIPAAKRAEMINDPGLRFRNPELAAHLAEDEPEVAAAALARANLTEDEWATLIPRLPVRARGFLRLRGDMGATTNAVLERLGIRDRGLPRPDALETDALETDGAEPDGAEADEAEPSGAEPDGAKTEYADTQGSEAENASLPESSAIGALVQRIEQFRKARGNAPNTRSDPHLPLDGLTDEHAKAELTAFSFTCDGAGRIDWASEAVAPSLIGMVLNNDAARLAMRFRQPMTGQRMTLAGAPAIAGDWIADAFPRFRQQDGHFYGYAGTFRREAELSADNDDDAASLEADRLRQLLHELRTPVNAIQGFSEVIQQQLFGPAPHEYRALAANIAGDSARMLAGFDELDRLARLETGALDMEAGVCDFGTIVSGQIDQLQTVLKPKNATFEFRMVDAPMVAMARGDGEALAWRFLANLAAAVGAGEHVHVELAVHGGALRLCCEIPASLCSVPDIFATTPKPAGGVLSAGMFGAGFALRLARAEARGAGGDLARVDDWLILSLPLLTSDNAAPSQQQANGTA